MSDRCALAIGGVSLLVPVLAACSARAVHIPGPHMPQEPTTGAAEASAKGEPPAAFDAAFATRRLRAPDSRASVLRLVALFQSSIASGEPPLEALTMSTTSLSAPGADGRRTSPNRANVVGLLDASFVSPALDFDPLEVSIRSTDRGATATVPLPASSATGRRMLLELSLAYRGGALRIADIALLRAP